MVATLTDLVHYICGPETCLREVVSRIDRLPAGDKFQVIVGDDTKVLGTVTDGDIRRAILNGCDLDSPIAPAMHTEMTVGRQGEAKANRDYLASLESNVPFLPVVDADGRLREILLPEHGAFRHRNLHALVQAGGFGRRLGRRTRKTPKPLLPIAGRPILDHILERLENSGVRHIWLSVHYLSEQIEAFVAARRNRSRIGLLYEDQPLGTAGSIGLIPDRSFTDLLVVNGDILTSLDFDTFVHFHYEHENEATIAAAICDVQIPFGVIRYSESGAFQGIDEKPRLRHFVSAGINILSDDLCRLVGKNAVLDMPSLINRGQAVGMSFDVFPIHEYWTDMGRPEDFDAADSRYRQATTP